MDFLFAPLPETNFQMNTEELRLWQRNAIFECECDNFINRRIETGRTHLLTLPNRPHFELPGIDAAIRQHGLRLPDSMANSEHRPITSASSSQRIRNVEDDSRRDSNADSSPSLPQRRRLATRNVEDDRDNMLDRIYQEALLTAFRTRGLSAIRNP
ncbi:uncharacterized protein LOC105208851 [Zeugodacus cucurbitae]|uniref:Transcription termination factor Rho n=1 Tax=Zeugodacus cucurbitae TaxID=28588 RepID=A0A0A1WJK1_ZEUCU|nr:uncharacterized protein LOC105208851 [Zeugodacus cucurbitae]